MVVSRLISVRRPWYLAIVLLLGGLTVVGLRSDETSNAALADRIDAVLNTADARSGFWGVYVQDLQSGEVLYQHNADKPLIPASNQKVLTAATALDALGSDYRYQTGLYFDGVVDGTVLRGDLILRGSGDPTLSSVEVRGRDPLQDWARELAALGITRIEGRLLGDDSVFDNKPYAEGWDIDYLTSQSSRMLGVSTSGLAYRDNVISIQIRSTRAGARAEVNTLPEGYLDLRNQTSTSSRRRGFTTTIERVLGTETVVIRGTVPRSYRGTVEIPVTDPTAFTLYTLDQHLRDAGIETALTRHNTDDLDQRPRYDRAQLLFVHLSPPLAEILEIVNKESNNFFAEQVFRSISPQGSADASERRIKALFTRAGASTDGISVRDGSGLSRKDFVTPEAMVKLLAYMYEHEEREAFIGSLPKGGEPKTTLHYRLRDVPVRAKTGSLQYVRALSGYATTSNSRPVAFTVLVNNYTAPSYRIMRTIDRVVLTLTSSNAG